MKSLIKRLFRRKPLNKCPVECDAHKLIVELYEACSVGYGSHLDFFDDKMQPHYVETVFIGGKVIYDKRVIKAFENMFRYLYNDDGTRK